MICGEGEDSGDWLGFGIGVGLKVGIGVGAGDISHVNSHIYRVANRFAIIGYDYYLLNQGQISVQINGVTVMFSKEQYEVTNTNWIVTDTIVPGIPLPFPTTTIINADNGKYTLTLTINVDATGYVNSQPIDNQIWLVLESNAAFTGEFSGPGICQTISDGGFREFSLDVPFA